MNEKELQKKIMRRVKVVHLGKQIYQPIIVRSVLLIALFLVGNAYASITSIAHNMSSINSLGGFYNFTVSAFINTELIVQVVCFGIVGVLMVVIWGKAKDKQVI